MRTKICCGSIYKGFSNEILVNSSSYQPCRHNTDSRLYQEKKHVPTLSPEKKHVSDLSPEKNYISDLNLQIPKPGRISSALLNIEKIIEDELRAFRSTDTTFGNNRSTFRSADTTLGTTDTMEDVETKSLISSDLDEGFFDRNSATPDSSSSDTLPGNSEYTLYYRKPKLQFPVQET